MANRSYFAALSLNPPKIAVGNRCFVGLTAMVESSIEIEEIFNNHGVVVNYDPFNGKHEVGLIGIGIIDEADQTRESVYRWFEPDDLDRAL